MDCGKYNTKTLRITEKTHQRLDTIRRKDETYNTVIEHLLEHYEENKRLQP